MDSISPSKRPTAGIVTRANLRATILRICAKKNQTDTEKAIILDARSRLLRCEKNMTDEATESLLNAGWKLKCERALYCGGILRVYVRTKEEGVVYLKNNGDLTTEVINVVAADLLKMSLTGRSLRYQRSHGVTQRIFTHGWTPEQQHYIRNNFKDLITLEDTSNVAVSKCMRMPTTAETEGTEAVTDEKSIQAALPNRTPDRPKRPASAFLNLTPKTPGFKKARLSGP